MFAFSLRFWCAMQIVYERQLHAHNPAATAEAEEHWRTMRQRTIAGGHVDTDFFGVLDMHDDRLREPMHCTDEAILDAARARIIEYLRIGLAESCHLADYVGAVSRHLRDCKKCRRDVCDATRAEMGTAEKLRDLGRHLRASGTMSQAAKDRILRGLQQKIVERKLN